MEVFLCHAMLEVSCLYNSGEENDNIITSYQQSLGKNTVKGTMVTKVGVFTKDYILHLSYMYWSIKYQNYILNVISRTRY
jgi:hypothetical protein